MAAGTYQLLQGDGITISYFATASGTGAIGDPYLPKHDISSVAGTVAVTSVAGSLGVGGDTASGAADAGNPLKIGGIAATALPTAVANAQRAGVMLDKFGRQVVIPQTVRDLVTDATTTITASTAETTILAAVASVFLDATCIWIANTSATAARVDIRDTTAGTIRASIYVPAGDTRGWAPPVPMTQTTVNTNWTAQSSASVTDLRIYIQAVKNK